MNISDKTVMVSGGASGLGKAVCQHLSGLGFHVLVLDKNAEGANQIAKELKGQPLACDITNETDLAEVFNALPNDLKKNLKVVVNCAGIAPAKRMVGKDGPIELSWFEEVVKVNLIGAYNVMRLAVDVMIKARTEHAENGVIINTASVAAFDGQIGQSAYSASKGGIVSMTLPLARELAQFGIRVMAIAPGIFKTPMMEAMPTQVQTALNEQTVYPKRLGEAVEFAQLVAHIIENPMLNGSTIRLDGAMRMP